MLKGLASLKFRWSEAKRRHAARYCVTTAPAASAPKIAGQRAVARLDAGGETATLALGVIPDLLHKALVALEPKLNDDINQEVEELLDIGPRQLPTRRTLLDQEHQLLKREFRARRVHARDGARVA